MYKLTVAYCVGLHRLRLHARIFVFYRVVLAYIACSYWRQTWSMVHFLWPDPTQRTRLVQRHSKQWWTSHEIKDDMRNVNNAVLTLLAFCILCRTLPHFTIFTFRIRHSMVHC